MDFLRHFWPHLTAAFSGLSTLLLYWFRDEITKWRDERRRDRQAEREERANVHGRGDRALSELVALIRADLDKSWTRADKIDDLLTRMVVANERSLDVQRTLSNQLSDFDKRLGHIEGARGIQ